MILKLASWGEQLDGEFVSGLALLKKPAVVALAVGAFGLSFGVGSASAAESVGILDGQPTCVGSWVHEQTLTQTAYVESFTCTTTKMVRIVWAFGADSVCFELRPGQKASTTIPSVPRRFEGHKAC
jgi:hypothetical protein